MQTLETLYILAENINESWRHNEAVDWGEAEQLVREFKNIPDEILSAMPEIVAIIHYADSYNEWDSEEVALWPDVIRSEIESFDKQYIHRVDGENWEIYSIALTGEEEWKATVETEAIAEHLVKSLSTVKIAANPKKIMYKF